VIDQSQTQTPNTTGQDKDLREEKKEELKGDLKKQSNLNLEVDPKGTDQVQVTEQVKGGNQGESNLTNPQVENKI